MATPFLTRHRLPGYLGDILIDVRTGDRTNPRPAVVIVPGFKGFKDWGMFPPLADRLAKAGFTAVSLNVSGSGVDDAGDFVFLDQFAHATYSGDLSDIGQVVDALATGMLGVPTPSALGMFGHSRGGGLAILAAAGDPRISALVTWAAISHVDRYPPDEVAAWRARGYLDVVNSRTGQVLPMYTDVLNDVLHHGAGSLDIPAAASELQAAWLIVHGSDDTTVARVEADTLQLVTGGRAELLIVPGAGHTFGSVHPWQGPTPSFDSAADASLQWFGRHLR